MTTSTRAIGALRRSASVSPGTTTGVRRTCDIAESVVDGTFEAELRVEPARIGADLEQRSIRQRHRLHQGPRVCQSRTRTKRSSTEFIAETRRRLDQPLRGAVERSRMARSGSPRVRPPRTQEIWYTKQLLEGDRRRQRSVIVARTTPSALTRDGEAEGPSRLAVSTGCPGAARREGADGPRAHRISTSTSDAVRANDGISLSVDSPVASTGCSARTARASPH